MSVTYSKLRDGSWGVRGPTTEVKPGARVDVRKKSGEIKGEVVKAVLWTDGKIVIATIAQAERRSARGRSRRSYDDDDCHTDGNCSSMCSPSSCPCGDGSWFRCC